MKHFNNEKIDVSGRDSIILGHSQETHSCNAAVMGVAQKQHSFLTFSCPSESFFMCARRNILVLYF